MRATNLINERLIIVCLSGVRYLLSSDLLKSKACLVSLLVSYAVITVGQSRFEEESMTNTPARFSAKEMEFCFSLTTTFLPSACTSKCLIALPAIFMNLAIGSLHSISVAFLLRSSSIILWLWISSENFFESKQTYALSMPFLPCPASPDTVKE